MNFLYPQFLFALAAAGIPVIIHLFQFRRYRKIYFTNVRLLHEAAAESYSRNRLRHILVLLARMLAIAALVFAFARPYIPSGEWQQQEGEQAISIYIDNSFSMDATGAYGHLFEEAMEKARDIVTALPSATKVSLLTGDFEPAHQRYYNREDFLKLMEKVKTSSAFRYLSEVMLRQADLLAEESAPVKRAYILSDFRLNNTDLAAMRPDTQIRYILVPVSVQPAENLSVDSAWFESPVREESKPDKVLVKVTNHSGNPHPNLQVKLTIDGAQKSLATLNLAEGESAHASLPFTIRSGGIHFATLSVKDDPVTFDDELFFCFEISTRLRLLCMRGSERDTTATYYLSLLFGRDDFFTMDQWTESTADYSALPQYAVVILCGLRQVSSGLSSELAGYVRNGGVLAVFPPIDADIESYKEFLHGALGTDFFLERDTVRSSVLDVNAAHPLYEGVFDPEKLARRGEQDKRDLPVAMQHLRLSRQSRTTGEPLMFLENGDAFLERYTAGKGFVYLFAAPLEEKYTNFPVHAIFVPVLHRMVLLSPSPQPLYYTIGKDEVVEVRGRERRGDLAFHIRSFSSEAGGPLFQFIPEQKRTEAGLRLSTRGQVKEAGFYQLLLAGDTLAGLAFNYDRRESDMAFIAPDELKKEIGDRGISNVAVMDASPQRFSELALSLSAEKGTKLWKLFLIFALAFFAAEILLLRVWK